jgi:hypothetical protein
MIEEGGKFLVGSAETLVCILACELNSRLFANVNELFTSIKGTMETRFYV